MAISIPEVLVVGISIVPLARVAQSVIRCRIEVSRFLSLRAFYSVPDTVTTQSIFLLSQVLHIEGNDAVVERLDAQQCES